mmetsp:Transcript_39725/g.118218  ORF Transcript_39725/g.118218 Transcript_39725/m.118218 type:complete len:228 (+) Transcript_39725:3287-3970(+)
MVLGAEAAAPLGCSPPPPLVARREARAVAAALPLLAAPHHSHRRPQLPRCPQLARRPQLARPPRLHRPPAEQLPPDLPQPRLQPPPQPARPRQLPRPREQAPRLRRAAPRRPWHPLHHLLLQLLMLLLPNPLARPPLRQRPRLRAPTLPHHVQAPPTGRRWQLPAPHVLVQRPLQLYIRQSAPAPLKSLPLYLASTLRPVSPSACEAHGTWRLPASWGHPSSPSGRR